MRAAMHVVSDIRELLEHDTENVCELLAAALLEHAEIGPVSLNIAATKDDGTALTVAEIGKAKATAEVAVRDALRSAGVALGG